MIKQYKITLSCDNYCKPSENFGYMLYSQLLSDTPTSFANMVHNDSITPISQYFTYNQKSMQWTVSVFGTENIDIIDNIIKSRKVWNIKKHNINLNVVNIDEIFIEDLEDLFAKSKQKYYTLRFQTATSFKSKKVYQNFPSVHLIVQSLVRKWNSYFPESEIIDDDGEGLNSMVAGLNIKFFDIKSVKYILKSQEIQSFKGYLTIENNLTGFHNDLINMLFYFANFSGIGIKTTLGMGGVVVEFY